MDSLTPTLPFNSHLHRTAAANLMTVMNGHRTAAAGEMPSRSTDLQTRRHLEGEGE
jgi:hypothetical protein